MNEQIVYFYSRSTLWTQLNPSIYKNRRKLNVMHIKIDMLSHWPSAHNFVYSIEKFPFSNESKNTLYCHCSFVVTR